MSLQHPSQLTTQNRACFLVTISCLLFVMAVGKGRGEDAGRKTVIPSIAGLAGIRVGYSTMSELEARLGPGKAITGGHPNGARLWRVKGTRWLIHADAFEYSDRGIVVDSLSISEDPNPGEDVPFARVRSDALRWLGKISLGMGNDEVTKALGAGPVPAKKSAQGWEVRVPGYCRLSEYVRFDVWTAGLDFTNNVLSQIRLDARQETSNK